MPKVRGFSSEPMRWDRLLCADPDAYPLDVGLLATHAPREMGAWTQGFTRFLLPTMRKHTGKITRLRCKAGLFRAELGRSLFGKHVPSTFSHLTSIDLSYSWAEWRNWVHWRHEVGDGYTFLRSLQGALFAATDLRELSIAFDCGLEGYGPPFRLPNWMFRDEEGKIHRWKYLRSLRLAYLMRTEAWLVPLVAAHADSLRHLDLENCNLDSDFASGLAWIKGKAPRLSSIRINEPGVHESKLIPEERLLHYIHHGERDAYKKWAEKTGRDTSLDDVEAGPEDWTPDSEEDTDDEDMLSEDSDYSPEFEYTAESEEDYNSDDEPPPLLRWVKPGWSETKQIAAGRFVTHSNLCENAGYNDRRDDDDDDDDEASDHSSEWWSDDDDELSVDANPSGSGDTDEAGYALLVFLSSLVDHLSD